MADNCNCKCGKLTWCVISVIILVAVIFLFRLLTSKKPSEEVSKPAETKIEDPVKAVNEFTQSLVDERANDKDYQAVLDKFASEQAHIAEELNVASEAMQAWINDFLATHPELKSLSSEELMKRASEDEKGKAILDAVKAAEAKAVACKEAIRKTIAKRLKEQSDAHGADEEALGKGLTDFNAGKSKLSAPKIQHRTVLTNSPQRISTTNAPSLPVKLVSQVDDATSTNLTETVKSGENDNE